MTRDVREHRFRRGATWNCRSRDHDEGWNQAVGDHDICAQCDRCRWCADLERCPGLRAEANS